MVQFGGPGAQLYIKEDKNNFSGVVKFEFDVTTDETEYIEIGNYKFEIE